MLRQHLEADKVCVLGSDGLTIEEDVPLGVQQLFEGLQVQGAAPVSKQLGFLHMRVKHLEYIWMDAVAIIEMVELLHVLSALSGGSLLHPKKNKITIVKFRILKQ